MKETHYLRENIQNFQRLMDIPALKNFETDQLSKLLRLSKVRVYNDGECIIKEGDVDPWLYFLLSGKIQIVKDGVQIAHMDKRGEIFGEMRIISDQVRSASIYAVGRTVCLAVDTKAEDRLDSQEEIDKFLLMLYKVFAEFVALRLRLTNEELVRTKKEILRLVQDDMFLEEP
ncbi:MAG: cyclic nucleotide-binding domain-containing protein [Desulfobacterales bacterium]